MVAQCLQSNKSNDVDGHKFHSSAAGAHNIMVW